MTQNHLHNTVIQAEKEALETFISEHKKTLTGRKLVGEFILFSSCQILSASLAILLFQYTIKLWVLSLICYGVGIAPNLPELCEISINRDDEGNVQVNIMRNPVKSIVKLVFSAGLTYIGIQEVRASVRATYQGFDKVYGMIKDYETPKTAHYNLPVEPWILFFILACVAVSIVFRGKFPD